MYLVNLRFGWKFWWSVLFSIMLVVGWAITPAGAHCKKINGVVHIDCKGGEDPPPPSGANPAIVFVAVSSAGPDNDLMVADADGSNQTALLSSNQAGFFFPAWSPDLEDATPGFQGSVVFELWTGPVDAPLIDLRLIDVTVSAAGVETANERELVQDASAAAWSPQGDKIAYQQ